MQILTRLLGVFLGLALLAGLGVAGFVALEWLLQKLMALDAAYSTLLTNIASVACLTIALVMADKARRAGKNNSVGAAFERRSAAYAEFLQYWHEWLQRAHRPGAFEYEDQLVDAESLDQALILLGSARVLKAHIALRMAERQGELDTSSNRRQFIDALIQIRQELGQDSRGIEASALAGLCFPESDPTGRTTEPSSDPESASEEQSPPNGATHQ